MNYTDRRYTHFSCCCASLGGGLRISNAFLITTRWDRRAHEHGAKSQWTGHLLMQEPSQHVVAITKRYWPLPSVFHPYFSTGQQDKFGWGMHCKCPSGHNWSFNPVQSSCFDRRWPTWLSTISPGLRCRDGEKGLLWSNQPNVTVLPRSRSPMDDKPNQDHLASCCWCSRRADGCVDVAD